jgi:hypothetical protein
VQQNSKSSHQNQLQQAKQNENASLTQLITQAKKSAAGKQQPGKQIEQELD